MATAFPVDATDEAYLLLQEQARRRRMLPQAMQQVTAPVTYDYSDLNSILPSAMSRQMSPDFAAPDITAAAPEMPAMPAAAPVEAPQTRALPQAVEAAQSTLTQNVQPGDAVGGYRQKAAEFSRQATEAMNQEPDMAAAQNYMRQRAQQGDMAMLNALAAQFAGERFEPIQAKYLKRAAAAREPMKVGRGMITPDGQFIRDEGAAQDQRVQLLLQQAKAYEQMALTAETEQERRAARQAQQATENRLRELGLQVQQQRVDIARQAAEDRAKGGGGQAGSFSPAGFTPQGQQIVTNTKSGISYLLNLQPDGTPNYIPYQGPMIPTATFNKEVGAAGDLKAVASRADNLVKQVEANPNAFGLRSAAVSSLPGAMQGYAAQAVGLTPEQLQARSTVLRQAAQEINELYGAALSMGEQARANTFLPNPADPPEVLISKLKAARDWAKSQLGRYSPGVTNAASQRSGDAAPAQQNDPLGLRR